MEARMRIAQD